VSLSDEQRAGLALVLMVIVLMLWSQFYKPPEKPPQANPPAAAIVQQPPATVAPGEISPSQTQTKAARATQAAPAVAIKQAKMEETITVESGLYRVELSNRGAVARSWRMKKELDSETPPKPLELVHADAARQLKAWPLSVRLGDAGLDAAANSGLYVVNTDSTTLSAPAEVDLEWSDGHLEVSKRLKFGTDYETSIEISATLDGKPLPVGLAWRGGFGDESVYNAPELVQVYYSTGGKLYTLAYKKLGDKDHPEQPAIATENAEYGGLQDQFFTAAFLPNESGLAIWDETEQQNIMADGKSGQQPVVEMAAGTLAPGPWSVRLYVGPKDFAGLAKVRPPLTALVQFGYVGIIAKPLLALLKWIYHYIPNYGWCVILLTLGISLVLFPLKVKGWRSMQRMQKVAPEVNSIKDKYKKYSLRDPRRKGMNDEIMAVYQREGINPMAMGGCLPTLVQLPILWALWRMLEYSIELRHAPWIGWIHDLSARDPYYILPFLVTVTMYFMSKMTPVAPMGDPAQQKMMKYMPLAFGFFFFALSAGVNLYMVTSNVVGAAQQWYLMKNQPLPSRSPFKNKPAKS
jgi:YidC/Oxa1 family membrane protein insertase